jgi:hypothetical protein
MRTTEDPHSPWGVRLWFEDEEFDQIMDGVRGRAGEVFSEGRGVDVEEVFMRVYALSPDYLELPPGVLGRTVFHADGLVDVHLSRDLSERAEGSRVARRRLRSTMGHECGHVALHRSLEPRAAGVRTDAPAILCRPLAFRRGGERAGEWWEYQANRAMACLLMPKDLTITVLSGVLQARGYETLEKALEAESGREVLGHLSRVFDVSFEMVLYRLVGLGLLPPTPASGVNPTE